MNYLIFGFPLVFWLGLLTFLSLMIQMALGYYLTHGYPSVFKWHKINAGILTILVATHVLLGISLYL